MSEPEPPVSVRDYVPAAMEREGWTYDSIERRSNGNISGGTLRSIVKGRRHPTMTTLEIIADLFGVNRNHFAEWQLAAARNRFDERTQGLDEALANLRRYETAVQAWDAVASEPEAPPEPGRVRHLRSAKSASGRKGQDAS